MKILYLLLLSLLSLTLQAQSTAPDPKEVLLQMIRQINHTKSLSYTFKKKERVHNGFATAEQDIQLLTQPMKAHIYIHKPNKGTVAIWSPAENNGDVQVTPGWLPFLTVNLSPQSAEIRKNNHHSIHKLGFEFLATIINHSLNKQTTAIQYEGSYLVNNRACHKVIIDFKDYQYRSYTIKPNENLVQIADKFRINEFMILLNNPHIKGFHEVKEGQVIVIPSEYAKRTELYIDKENLLPIVQRMYDEKGLFEQYEFINLQYNPSLNDAIFVVAAR